MQNVSNLYNSIYAGNHIVRYKVEIAGTDYFNTPYLIDIKRTSALFDNFGIGFAVMRTLSLRMMSVFDIPKGAQIKVYFRLEETGVDTPSVSEWIPKGTFFIAERSVDTEGMLNITAYDAMLKADAVYMKSGTYTSMTAYSLAYSIASKMGISLDPETATRLQQTSYPIGFIPLIAEDGTTMRELLSYIGAMYCGNWIISDSNKLKLIGINDLPETTNYLITKQGDNITFGGDRIVLI